MKIVLFGSQGSGKGTYASRLSPILKIPHISTGDMFRDAIKNQTELGKQVEEYVNQGKYVPDDIVINVLKERLKQEDAQNGYMLDGYPRTLRQAEVLEEFSPTDIVINLVVPEEVIIYRLSNRRICKNCQTIFNLKTLKPQKEGICDKCGGELYQREDDTPEGIRKRLKQYEELTQPLLNFYKERGIVKNVVCQTADIPPKLMVKKILNILKISD